MLHGVYDAGSRVIFMFRSGMHGPNEELGIKIIGIGGGGR